MKTDKLLAYVAFGIVCLVWGTTYLGIAIVIETLPTFLFAGTRFTLGGLLLLVIALARGEKLPREGRDWANLALIGVLMVGVANAVVVWAEHYLSSGFAALLVATAPFWMAVLEALRGNSDFTGRKVLGMLVGFSGVAILVAPELRVSSVNLHLLIGVIALQVGSIAWNYGSIRAKYHVSRNVQPFTSAALQMLLGGLVVSTFGLARGEASAFHFNARTLTAYLYLVVFGSVVAYGAYVYALSKLKTSTTSLYAYINPLVAVVLGWLILDEKIGWNVLVAMLVIFSGVALVQTAPPRSRKIVEAGTAVAKPLDPAEV